MTIDERGTESPNTCRTIKHRARFWNMLHDHGPPENSIPFGTTYKLPTPKGPFIFHTNYSDEHCASNSDSACGDHAVVANLSLCHYDSIAMGVHTSVQVIRRKERGP